MKNRIVVRENEQRLKIMMGVRRHQNTKNRGDVEPQSKENDIRTPKSGRRRTPKQRKRVVKYHKNRKRSNINVSLSMKISMRTESEQKYCLRKKEINRKKESKMLEISIRSTSEASGQRGHHHQKRERIVSK